MAVDEDILREHVDTILGTSFSERDGRVVPTTDDVALKDGAVKIDATFLYADLAGSATLADKCPWDTTAKVIRAFLDISTRLIRVHGGEIRSFDGDRVMGVFIGDIKNTSACRCGREIHWAVRKILQERATAKFASIRNNKIVISHCVGIDSGEVRAVRSGIRNHNDLIWIGKAASFSAKLSDVRDAPYCTYISSRVYNKLGPTEKKNGDDNIWTPAKFTFAGKEESVYKSNHWKKP
jgi:adenylate cyclase